MPGLTTMCVITKLKIGDLEEKSKQGKGNVSKRKRKSRGLYGGVMGLAEGRRVQLLRSLSGWQKQTVSHPNPEKHSYLPSSSAGVGCQPLKPVHEPRRPREAQMVVLTNQFSATLSPSHFCTWQRGQDYLFFLRFQLNLFLSTFQCPALCLQSMQLEWWHVQHTSTSPVKLPPIYLFILNENVLAVFKSAAHMIQEQPAGPELTPNSQRTEVHRLGVARTTQPSSGFLILNCPPISLMGN